MSAGLRKMKRRSRALVGEEEPARVGVEPRDAESTPAGPAPARAAGPWAAPGSAAGSLTPLADARAERLELHLHALVAAVEVIHARDLGRARARRGPRARATRRRGDPWPSPARPGRPARRGPPRSEPSVSMRAPMRLSSAACMNRFSKIVSEIFDRPSASAEQRHELRLHVGGEARERARDHVGRRAGRSGPWHRTRSPVDLDGGAALLQLGEGRGEVARRRAGHGDVAAGDGPRHEERARLDAVGDDPVARAAELGHALDLDPLGARALDAGAHGDEEPREVRHLRLARGVLDAPWCPRRGPPPSSGSRCRSRSRGRW